MHESERPRTGSRLKSPWSVLTTMQSATSASHRLFSAYSATTSTINADSGGPQAHTRPQLRTHPNVSSDSMRVHLELLTDIFLS